MPMTAVWCGVVAGAIVIRVMHETSITKASMVRKLSCSEVVFSLSNSLGLLAKLLCAFSRRTLLMGLMGLMGLLGFFASAT
jgi:hypothetical protein